MIGLVIETAYNSFQVSLSWRRQLSLIGDWTPNQTFNSGVFCHLPAMVRLDYQSSATLVTILEQTWRKIEVTLPKPFLVPFAFKATLGLSQLIFHYS